MDSPPPPGPPKRPAGLFLNTINPANRVNNGTSSSSPYGAPTGLPNRAVGSNLPPPVPRPPPPHVSQPSAAATGFNPQSVSSSRPTALSATSSSATGASRLPPGGSSARPAGSSATPPPHLNGGAATSRPPPLAATANHPPPRPIPRAPALQSATAYGTPSPTTGPSSHPEPLSKLFQTAVQIANLERERARQPTNVFDGLVDDAALSVWRTKEKEGANAARTKLQHMYEATGKVARDALEKEVKKRVAEVASGGGLDLAAVTTIVEEQLVKQQLVFQQQLEAERATTATLRADVTTLTSLTNSYEARFAALESRSATNNSPPAPPPATTSSDTRLDSALQSLADLRTEAERLAQHVGFDLAQSKSSLGKRRAGEEEPEQTVVNGVEDATLAGQLAKLDLKVAELTGALDQVRGELQKSSTSASAPTAPTAVAGTKEENGDTVMATEQNEAKVEQVDTRLLALETEVDALRITVTAASAPQTTAPPTDGPPTPARSPHPHVDGQVVEDVAKLEAQVAALKADFDSIPEALRAITSEQLAAFTTSSLASSATTSLPTPDLASVLQRLSQLEQDFTQVRAAVAAGGGAELVARVDTLSARFTAKMTQLATFSNFIMPILPDLTQMARQYHAANNPPGAPQPAVGGILPQQHTPPADI